MRGADQPDGLVQQRGERLLALEREGRRTTAEVAVDDVGPLGAGELLAGLAAAAAYLAFGAEACFPIVFPVPATECLSVRKSNY